MLTFTQYIPAYVYTEGTEPLTFTFNTMEELLDLSIVRSFVKNNFHQFSLSTNLINPYGTLMVEYDEGYTWYPIGTITPVEDMIDLAMANGMTKWEPKQKENK